MSDDIVVAENQKPNLVEFKRLGFKLTFEISADGQQCVCSYEPNPAGSSLTHEEIQKFFLVAKIREGILDDAVDALVAKAKACESVKGMVIARGTPMMPGEDGKLSFAVQDSLADNQTKAADEGDTVDLRNIQQFLNVTSGQLIGTVLPPGEGVAGKTISGTVIPAQSGKELKLKPGNSVRLEGPSVFADADGRVYYSGDEISVEEVYTVKGDVDFRIGNIIFNGFVEVRGDVLDGFNVKAAKGIKIQGNIGKCIIESGGDLAFCGMDGQDKGSIQCKGILSANFLHDTKIECEDDIIVEMEIRNCDIKTVGLVRVNKGVLVGGTCIAMAGIEAATIGSPSSVFTRLVTGVNFRDLDELNRLFNELKKILEDFKTSTEVNKAEVLVKQRSAITEGIQELRARTYEKANAKVNVKKKLFEKVNITLGKISEEIKEERSGPLSIIANTVEGGIRFLSMTDLSANADDIEAAFVREAELAKQTNSNGGES